MRTLYHPNRENIALTAVLHALSDPNRLEIVKRLSASGEQACGSFGVALAKSTLSHHFKVLREAGVVVTRIVGTQRFVSLRQADLETRFPGLLDVILQAREPI